MRLTVLFMILLTILSFSQRSYACFENTGLPEQSLEEALSEAYAIGIFTGKWAGNGQRAVVYKLVTPYTDFPEKTIKVSLPSEVSMCDPPTPVEGMHELIIIKKDQIFFLSGRRLEREDWKLLRDKKDHGFAYKLNKRFCNITGGVWQTVGSSYPKYSCNHHYSDSYKICRDGNECKGECLAFLNPRNSDKQRDIEQENKRIAQIQSNGEKYGRCSVYKKQGECSSVIEDGNYISNNCDAGKKKR